MIHINSAGTETVRIFAMSNHHIHIPLDVKLVAKIGLSVAIASCLGLLLVLVAVDDETGGGYRQIIGAFGQAKQSLGPTMLVFGLVVAGFSGFCTWLFSLYTSFRIAGPLYRISRNLEMQIEQRLVAPTPLRASDELQTEWREFEASVAAIHKQHEELRQALAEVEKATREKTLSEGAASIDLSIARLKLAEQRVRL